MPLSELSSREALQISRNNRQSTVVPRAEIQVERTIDINTSPTFQLSAGARIFTVGSCFARHIERILDDFGFELSAARFPSELRFEPDQLDLLNKYTPVSIANEMRWAFDGHSAPPPEAALIPLGRHWWDGQLHGRNHRAELEEGLRRRAAVTDVYRSIPTCDAAIITFGLTETWFDRETGLYLNNTPPNALLNSDRFRCVLLSFNECLEAGRAILNTMFEAAPSTNVIVTVSPVALRTTFSADPITVRNCYSKSVLRAVVEHLRIEFPRIDYYPSYERVMYSDRSTAFAVDDIYVTPHHINHTIVTMLESYLDRDVHSFPSGSFRLWWKALFEKDAAAALQLWDQRRDEILAQARHRDAGELALIMAEFERLCAPSSASAAPAPPAEQGRQPARAGAGHE